MSSKLDNIENVDAKLTEWVAAGHSLMRIVGELKTLGLTVTNMTVRRRLQTLGLVTKNEPIAAKTGEGAWLNQFREKIVSYADTGHTYAKIWDRLAAEYPHVPQFQRELRRDAKTSAIAAWVHAERKRNARPRRSSLLEAFPAPGAPVPPYVVMQAPAGVARRPARAPATASVGLVRPAVPQVPVDSGADATGEPSFSIEARRKETAAQQQAHRAEQDAATSDEDKAKAAQLLARFKT